MLLLVIGPGCHMADAAYVCQRSTECVVDGGQGSCQPNGYCAFVDPLCVGSGMRYGKSFVGGGLADTCVEQPAPPDLAVPPPDLGSTTDLSTMKPPDLSQCGKDYAPCCTTGKACEGHLKCMGGTCQ
jgi:hypothetical protein